MEALAALSLACNVLTVIDSSVKLCKGLKAVYDTNGAAAVNQDLQKSSAELKRITESLDNSIKPANSSHTLSKHETELLGIAKSCDSIARELQNFTLPFTTITRRRDRIRLTWKAVFKDKKEVERLQQLLSQYQQNLQTELLVNILTQHKVTDLERTKDAAQHLDALMRLIDSSTTSHNHLSSLIAQQIAQINDHTSRAIQSAQKDDREARLLEQLLKSLRSSGMNERENTIVGNHPGTFRWIFGDPDSDLWLQEEEPTLEPINPPFDSLSAWLGQETTIYWISGKPGSGKSVLMKSISRSPEALRCLQIWSGGKDILILRHYFWLAGSEAQKSLKGFLASLLHQVLQQRKSTISTILQHKSAESKIEFSDWSVQELKSILQESLCSIDDHICIFVDGLDEMTSNNDMSEALQFSRSIATQQHIKVCISSRPTQLFCRAFDQVPCLHMHDLNEPDIFKYVCESLKALEDQYGTPGFDNTTTWIEEIHHVPILQIFTRHITTHAEGVFLWAAIVLGQIRDGFVNADTWKVLFERVKSYPQELKDLYESIWRNLNHDLPPYRAEASLYFRFMRFGWAPEDSTLEPTILLMALFADKEMQTALPTDLTRVSCELLARQCEAIIIRVRTRCAGLLELRPSNNPCRKEKLLSDGYDELESYENRYFSFFHRSAIDFLEVHDFGQQLGTAHHHEPSDLCHRVVSAISARASLWKYIDAGILDDLQKVLSNKGLAELDKAAKVALVNKIRVTWAVMLSTGRIIHIAKDTSDNTMYQTTSLSLPSPRAESYEDFLAWTIRNFGIEYAEHILSEPKNKISERYIQFLVKIVMLNSNADRTIDDYAFTCLLSYMPDLNFNFVDYNSNVVLPTTLLSYLMAKCSQYVAQTSPGSSNIEEFRSNFAPMVPSWARAVRTLWLAGYRFERRSTMLVCWAFPGRLRFESSLDKWDWSHDESSVVLEISDGHLLKLMLECFKMADLPLSLQKLARPSSSRFSVRPLLAAKTEHTHYQDQGLSRVNVLHHYVSPTEKYQQSFEKILTGHVQRYSLAVPEACELRTWFESAYAAGTRVHDEVSYMREVGITRMPDDPDVLCRPPPMFKDESELECHSKSRIRGEHDEIALSDDDEYFEDAVSEPMDS